MTIQTFPILYTVDSKGKLRTWRMEVEGDSHRAVSGIEGGKEVTSGWNKCETKNPGKKNERTAEAQAVSEVENLYKKKRDNKYYDDKNAAAGKKFFAPMLAEKWKDLKKKVDISKGVYSQPKLDGMRCVAKADGLWSRNGKPIVSAPHIHAALKPLFDKWPDLVLDGELYNHELKDDFDRVMELCRSSKPTLEDLIASEEMVQYHVYDHACPIDTFSERQTYIRKILSGFNDKVVLVHTDLVHDEETLDEVYGVYLEQGYEGQMVRLDLPYESKRSKSLMKRKEFMDAEFEVSAIREGFGNWAGAAKSIEYILPNDVRKENGKRPDSGIRGKKEKLELLWKRVQEGFLPKEVTVRFQGYTPRGIPRFPVVVAVWDNGRANEE